MQTKLIADLERGIYPLRIKIAEPAPLVLEYACSYSDGNMEYLVHRYGQNSGRIDWYYRDDELVLSNIQIHDCNEQIFGGQTDATGEGIGSAIIAYLHNLAAGLSCRQFAIWNTRNYALLYLAQKKYRDPCYSLLCGDGYAAEERRTWAQVFDAVAKVRAKFVFRGGYYELRFFRTDYDGWQITNKNEPFRLEFTEDNHARIYCTRDGGNFLVPKVQIEVVGVRYDILFPLGER
ncbi:MAG: hypothetical protein LBD99_03580 [Candidatus Margulisbacteria bacterium]|jgi:hypothetical protein|nr:hypothetical protein [Candidatus Margulisiibacteriota bacterium]